MDVNHHLTQPFRVWLGGWGGMVVTVPRRHASGQSAPFSTAVNTDATRSKKAHGRAWSSGILQPSNATAREAFDLNFFLAQNLPGQRWQVTLSLGNASTGFSKE